MLGSFPVVVPVEKSLHSEFSSFASSSSFDLDLVDTPVYRSIDMGGSAQSYSYDEDEELRDIFDRPVTRGIDVAPLPSTLSALSTFATKKTGHAEQVKREEPVTFMYRGGF